MKAGKGPDPGQQKDAAIVDGLLEDLFFGEDSKAKSGKKPRLSGSAPKPVSQKRPSAPATPKPVSQKRPKVAGSSCDEYLTSQPPLLDPSTWFDMTASSNSPLTMVKSPRRPLVTRQGGP